MTKKNKFNNEKRAKVVPVKSPPPQKVIAKPDVPTRKRLHKVCTVGCGKSIGSNHFAKHISKCKGQRRKTATTFPCPVCKEFVSRHVNRHCFNQHYRFCWNL